MGNADERHRTNGLDDRSPVRDRLRETRTQQAAVEIDHRSFRQAEAQRPAAQFVLVCRMAAETSVLKDCCHPYDDWMSFDRESPANDAVVLTTTRMVMRAVGEADIAQLHEKILSVPAVMS